MLLPNKVVIAGLQALIILQLVMLGALFAGVPPHPPPAISLFGIAPFLAVAIAAAAVAWYLGPLSNNAGRILAALAAALGLLSFGPQKYLDPQFPVIWPAVVSGQIAAIAVFTVLIKSQFQHSKRGEK